MCVNIFSENRDVSKDKDVTCWILPGMHNVLRNIQLM